MSCTTARTVKTSQQPCRKKCMLLEKRANNGMTVSFSHIRNHKMQEVNLQWKRVWWVEGNSFVRSPAHALTPPLLPRSLSRAVLVHHHDLASPAGFISKDHKHATT